MVRSPNERRDSTACAAEDQVTSRPASRGELLLRVVASIAAAMSIGSLLAKMFGLLPMRTAGLAIALPCSLLLIGIWVWARCRGMRPLATDLAIGFVAGVLATIAYDLFRAPFLVTGQRIFAPISAFGMWLTNAQRSSRLTELVGWTYHYSNGITLGVMYSLYMRGRHWAWAVVLACGLETAAIVSPFGTIFRLKGNIPGIAIAYLGHVAYGVPLGWLVWRWQRTRDWLATVPRPVWTLGAVLVGAALIGPFVSPDEQATGASESSVGFQVEGIRLRPDWLRIGRGETVRVGNPGPEAVTLRWKPGDATFNIPGGQQRGLNFPMTGIYQVFVETPLRTHSSFVIVEPAEGPE